MHRRRKELAELLGCWLRWLGFAGCGPAGFAGWACWLRACCLAIPFFNFFFFFCFSLFLSRNCCYPLSFFFFFYSTGSFQATLFPLNSRLARELFWSLNPVVWLERIIWALWASVACGPLISFLFILFSP